MKRQLLGTTRKSQANDVTAEESYVRFGSESEMVSPLHFMSVIPLKADIHRRGLHVRFVPQADLTPRHHRPGGNGIFLQIKPCSKRSVARRVGNPLSTRTKWLLRPPRFSDYDERTPDARVGFLVRSGGFEEAQGRLPHHLAMGQIRLVLRDLEEVRHQLCSCVVADVPVRHDE